MTTITSPRRQKIFSPLVLSQIATLVDQGVSPADIADRIGCKLSTLRVRCSQHGISLRRSVELSGELNNERRARLVIQLSSATLVGLHRQAQQDGISGARLAAALLEAVVRDELYEAVIDHEGLELRNCQQVLSAAGRR